MRIALDVVLVIAGGTIIVFTLFSAIRYTILPRAAQSWLTRQVFITIRVLLRLRTGRSPSYEQRDRTMAMYAPTALLSLLTSWLLLMIAGYTALYYALGVNSLKQALEVSGSAIFTLGTTTSSRFLPTLLTYSEAGLGLLLLTLLITYLPTIYGAFSRRETAVTQLEVRAGSPPAATTLLIRYQRIEKLDRLKELWRDWEQLFSELEESHTSFPALPFFRSPQPNKSWVTASGTVLDAASLWASTIEHPNDPDTQLCIRAGFIALRRIADQFHLPYDPDPPPDGPISISRYEYDEACGKLAEAGLPLREDLDAAWRSFVGWRINYDVVLLNLARITEAPIAPWTSDRSPLVAEVWSLRYAVRSLKPTRPARRSRRRAFRA